MVRIRVGANSNAAADVKPLGAGQLTRSSQYRIEHRHGQSAGEGVLLAWVVAAEQRPAAGTGLRPVAELRPRPRQLAAQRPDRPQGAVPGEGAERDDRLAALEQRQLALQV